MDDPVLHVDDLHRARAIDRGDEQAFDAFYQDAYPRVFRYARRHCGSDALAEEATQDALAIAFEQIGRYEGRSPLVAWVFGIARHCVGRHVTVDARVARFKDEAALEALLVDAERHGDADPHAAVARAELRAHVHGVLDRMLPGHVAVLEGKYVLGLSVREIAQHSGRTEKSIESTLSRARQAFREAFLDGASLDGLESEYGA